MLSMSCLPDPHKLKGICRQVKACTWGNYCPQGSVGHPSCQEGPVKQWTLGLDDGIQTLTLPATGQALQSRHTAQVGFCTLSVLGLGLCHLSLHVLPHLLLRPRTPLTPHPSQPEEASKAESWSAHPPQAPQVLESRTQALGRGQGRIAKLHFGLPFQNRPYSAPGLNHFLTHLSLSDIAEMQWLCSGRNSHQKVSSRVLNYVKA